jgi:hypothetical protein
MYKFLWFFFFLVGFLRFKKKNTFCGKPFYIDINTLSLTQNNLEFIIIFLPKL